MNTELNRDLMVSMLRRGSTGDEMLNILNVIVPDSDVEAIVEVPEDVIVVDPEFATIWV